MTDQFNAPAPFASKNTSRGNKPAAQSEAHTPNIFYPLSKQAIKVRGYTSTHLLDGLYVVIFCC